MRICVFCWWWEVKKGCRATVIIRAEMDRVGFVLGAGTSVHSRKQGRAVCHVRETRMMAAGGPQEGEKVPAWKVGLLAAAGVVASIFARPPTAVQAGIFGPSKLKLNDSEKISSGVVTVGAGLGLVYLAYKRNRQEDEVESQKIRVRPLRKYRILRMLWNEAIQLTRDSCVLFFFFFAGPVRPCRMRQSD